jgi:hypothetical protein
VELVAREVRECGLQFQPTDLMHMMVAFAMLQTQDKRLVDLVLMQCTSDLRACSANHLTAILWALAELRHPRGRCASSMTRDICT